MAQFVLEALDLERSFGQVRALRSVSLTVQPGELYGLVGPDGGGKTTVVRILAGLIAPTAGTARLCGYDPLMERRMVRHELGYMPQQYSLYGDLTVGENLRFFSQMFCLESRDFQARSRRLLEITRLAPFVGRRADALSGGMYKKLALACALLHRPKALLLDEPTNGVDPISRRELWDLLYEFVAEGMAVLLSTPYMDEAARCHRVGLIDEGRLLLSGPPDQLLARFEHGSFLVEDAERAAVERVLEGDPRVLALSPAGAKIRIVLRRGCEVDLSGRLGVIGARLVSVRPDFEDLFLVETQLATREGLRGH